MPERDQAAHELLLLAPRPRDDDPHGIDASSSRATSSGSSPVRRSIQAPCSSATSPVSVAPSWKAATGARQPPPTSARSGAPPRPACASPDRPRPPPMLPPRRTCSASDLPRLGEQLGRLEAAADLGLEAEPVEPARGQHDRVQPALAALAQPRVDAAQRLDRERRLEREQLGAAAHRRRPDPHPGPQLGRPAERVAWILARRVGTDREPSVSVEVMSFAEWTATSIRPARSASSSSLTKTPRSRSRRTASFGRGRPPS